MRTDAALRATAFALTTAHGGTDAIRLDSTDGATVVISLHGAQVLSWITADGRERLFLGQRSDFAPGSAIRGGIPVIFPQFAARGPLVRHGFARKAVWNFEGIDAEANAAVFTLRDDAATRAQWPHGFLARLLVAPGATMLEVTLEVDNTGPTAFEFSCALHNYLRVDALAATRLDGVAGASYIDSARDGALAREDDAALRFTTEIDRIHPGSDGDKTLHDRHGAVRVAMRGFTDTVVWNPGDALAARIADLAAGEHRQFVCIEPGCIVPPVPLAPQGSWRGSQRLTVLSQADITAGKGDLSRQ